MADAKPSRMGNDESAPAAKKSRKEMSPEVDQVVEEITNVGWLDQNGKQIFLKRTCTVEKGKEVSE